MRASEKEMAPAVLATPRDPAHSHQRRNAVDERILAQRAQHSLTRPEHEASEERRSCFYCLSGWVFLSSLDHDGEEIAEVIRCRKCGGTGRIYG